MAEVRNARSSVRVAFQGVTLEIRNDRSSVRVAFDLSTIPAAGLLVKVWTGTAWVDAPVQLWDGATWVDPVGLKTWNGGSFT